MDVTSARYHGNKGEFDHWERWDVLFLLFYFSICVTSIEMAFSLLVHVSMSICMRKSKAREES